MRHAKSDWHADYSDDHERPLNRRGVRDAGVMGRVLAGASLVPAHVISSTAVRARKTAELAKEAGRWECLLELDRRLYEAGVADILEICATSPEVDPMMIVGHQPTWSMLVSRLTGARVEMKTAAVAVIEIPVPSWSEVLSTTGSLVDLLEPGSFVS